MNSIISFNHELKNIIHVINVDTLIVYTLNQN